MSENLFGLGFRQQNLVKILRNSGLKKQFGAPFKIHGGVQKTIGGAHAAAAMSVPLTDSVVATGFGTASCSSASIMTMRGEQAAGE